jgi:hypothetical protein
VWRSQNTLEHKNSRAIVETLRKEEIALYHRSVIVTIASVCKTTQSNPFQKFSPRIQKSPSGDVIIAGVIFSAHSKLIHPNKLIMANFTGLFITSGIAHAMPLLLAQSASSAGEIESFKSSPLSTVITIAFYVFVAFCTQTFLKKLNYDRPWLA